MATSTVRPITTVSVWGRSLRKAGEMADELRHNGLNAVAVDDLEKAVRMFIQKIHRANLIDFGRELDGEEDVHCLDAHDAALKAMEYLQTGVVRSLDEVLEAMKSSAL
ncbi:hypothetical protein [Granulosicoccus antarcticus]